eukprot:g6394.t1
MNRSRTADICVVLEEFPSNIREYMNLNETKADAGNRNLFAFDENNYKYDDIPFENSLLSSNWINEKSKYYIDQASHYLLNTVTKSMQMEHFRSLLEGAPSEEEQEQMKLNLAIDMSEKCLQTKTGGNQDTLYNAFFSTDPKWDFTTTLSTPWLDKYGDGNTLDLSKSLDQTGGKKNVHTQITDLIGNGKSYSAACSTLTSLEVAKSATETALANIETKLRVALKARSELFIEVGKLEKFSGCGYVNLQYDKILHETCGNALGSLSYLVVSFFLLGCFGLLSVFFAIKTGINVFGRGQKKVTGPAAIAQTPSKLSKQPSKLQVNPMSIEEKNEDPAIVAEAVAEPVPINSDKQGGDQHAV